MAPPPETTAPVVALSLEGGRRQWVVVGTATWVTDDPPHNSAKGPVLSITIHGEPFSWRDGSSPREIRVRPPRRRVGSPLSRLPQELAAWVAAQPPNRLLMAADYLRAHGYEHAAAELTRRAPPPVAAAPAPSQHRRKTP